MLSRYNNSYNNTNNNTTSNPTTPRQLTTTTAMSPTLSSSTTTALTTTNYHHNNTNEHNGNGNNGNGNTVFRSSNIMMLSTGTGHRLPSTTTNTTNATNATAIATTTNVMITSNNNNNDPMQVKIKNLLTRVQSLQSPAAAASSSSFITSASSSSSSAFHNIPIPMKTPTEIYSMARRWLYAYKELMELSEFKISLELVYAFYYVLIQTQFFFLIDLGEEPIDHIHPIHQTVQYPTRWEEFIALQEVSNDR